MKLAACLSVVLLSGCMSYGSWLEEVGKAPNPPRAMSQEDAAFLTQEARRLRVEAEGVRVKLSREADRSERIRYLEQLRDIGDRLRPVEAELRNAGRLA